MSSYVIVPTSAVSYNVNSAVTKELRGKGKTRLMLSGKRTSMAKKRKRHLNGDMKHVTCRGKRQSCKNNKCMKARRQTYTADFLPGMKLDSRRQNQNLLTFKHSYLFWNETASRRHPRDPFPNAT